METTISITTNFYINYLNTLNKDILPALTYLESNRVFSSETIEKVIDRIFKKHKEYLDFIFNDHKVDKISRLGDMHRKGRCTLLVETKTDKFICKPVDIDLIVTINSILSLLNNSGIFDVVFLNILSKHKKYTKINYIQNDQCINSAKFSHHYGALIFTLTLLRGVDFHSENIFCISSVPVIIDCESLFYPTILNTKPYDVTATSLIPTTLNSNSLIQKLKLSRYHINQGIIAAYNVFKNQKIKLANIITNNSEKKIRMIFKPTHYYYSLLKNSTHPTFLINKKKQQNYLNDSLLGQHEISKAIIHSEIADLSSLDIPYFYFQNNKLFNADDREIKQNFLQSSIDTIVHDVFDLDQFKSNLIKKMDTQ